jgi:hypothetical protein
MLPGADLQFGGSEAIKMLRPLTVTTILGYNYFLLLFLFHIITKNTN